MSSVITLKSLHWKQLNATSKLSDIHAVRYGMQWNVFTLYFRLGKDDFQQLIVSYPDLLQKVEALAIERMEKVLLIEEREKYRKPFSYKSINQRQFPIDRRSTVSKVFLCCKIFIYYN